jgi:hypothetical protein
MGSPPFQFDQATLNSRLMSVSNIAHSDQVVVDIPNFLKQGNHFGSEPEGTPRLSSGFSRFFPFMKAVDSITAKPLICN